MIFDIEDETILESILDGLEAAGMVASEALYAELVEVVDKSMPSIVGLITREAADKWRTDAHNSGGWGRKYAQAIAYEYAGIEGEVYLDESKIDSKGSKKPFEMFAMMVEKGVDTWSIRDALLASDKAKTSKDGTKYIIVPFPVATPRNEDSGKMARHFGKREMTTEMHKIVKSGGRLKAGTLPTGEDVSGLTKYNTKKFQAQYGIFRVVTENSEGWEYPNKSPQPVFPSVLKYVNKRIGEIIGDFAKEVVKDFSKK